MTLPPILRDKDHDAASMFLPENLLREARRQRNIPLAPVPDICVLDPDGDILDSLIGTGRAERDPAWACYHTDLHRFALNGTAGSAPSCGIVAHAVGASFAVLVAEQLFASGCKLLIGVTSSGQITATIAPPYFIVIERALRDEGTSYHYLPPADFSSADAVLIDKLMPALQQTGVPLQRGATWTTDAPFRETETAIAAARAGGILAVEMEAAALYAFAQARHAAVICLAHVTNQMGRAGDFEKGEANGARQALALIAAAAAAWSQNG